MKLTVDILQEIVAALDGTVTTVSYEGVPEVDPYGRNIYTINVVCSKWTTPSTIVSMQTHATQTGIREDFCVLEVSKTQVKVRDINPGQPSPFVSAGSNIITFPSPTLHYKHGTVIDTNDELVKIDDSTNKFPLVYVNEPFTETFNRDPESAVDRTSPLRIFFLSNFDVQDWNTDDHYKQVIQSMNNLADEFITYFRTAAGYGIITTEQRTNHVNLSVQRTLKGQETQVFDDYLSGVEIRFTLPIKNNCVNLVC